MKVIQFAMMVALFAAQVSFAQEKAAAPPFDEALATRLGADEYGMKKYVLVILKTGPNKMAAGPERDEMFRGHFANMKRLSEEGKLALAGPLDGVDGWRGLFILAVEDIEEAKKLAATDPVIINGEMVAEYHKYYGSAALMLVRETHDKLAKKQF
ncbi:MAG: YciI family protein [Thermoanaerobaculia bacterium]